MEDLIKKFVTVRFMENHRQSCLMMALENARILSGRDRKTGESRKAPNTGTVAPDLLESLCFKNNKYGTTDSFGGLIHYLILLDLIGEVLKPKNKTCNKTNIYKALTFFSSINDDEKWVIVALRNSLAHNYGLVNVPKNSKKNIHFTNSPYTCIMKWMT